MLVLSATSLDANPANKLADKPPIPEFLQLFMASEVIEIPRVFADGIGGTGRKTAPAASAAKRHRLIRIEGQVRQHRYEAETCSELRIYKKIVSADPT